METETNNIITGILIVSALFVLIAGFIIAYILLFNSRQRRNAKEKIAMQKSFELALAQSQIEVQESTFSTLGKELHDNVGQLLSTTKMLIGITQRHLQTAPATLITAEETLSQAIYEVRALSKSLSQEWLEQFNIIDNLAVEAKRINSGRDINITFSAPDHLPLASNSQIILFRIVQEAIQNAIKHAQASEIKIHLYSESNAVNVSINDNGIGLQENKQPEGIGIMNMKHRTKLLGGNITWQSMNGSGVTVNIHIPVKSKYEN